MANDNYCGHCGTHLDNPLHLPNCPAYDGAPPEPEGIADLREKLDVIGEAVTLLVESLVRDGDKKLEVLQRLREMSR